MLTTRSHSFISPTGWVEGVAASHASWSASAPPVVSSTATVAETPWSRSVSVLASAIARSLSRCATIPTVIGGRCCRASINPPRQQAYIRLHDSVHPWLSVAGGRANERGRGGPRRRLVRERARRRFRGDRRGVRRLRGRYRRRRAVV